MGQIGYLAAYSVVIHEQLSLTNVMQWIHAPRVPRSVARIPHVMPHYKTRDLGRQRYEVLD